jgi:hypothetical protein
MSKKSSRNENLQMGKPERAHDGYLPSVAPVTERNPASFTGAGVEIENRYGMEPYTKPGRGDSMIKPNH